MLEEKQGAVVDARQASAKAALIAQRRSLALDVLLLLLPLHAKRRIGQHVVKGVLPVLLVVRKGVLCEGVAEADVVGVFALDEHVGLANRPCLVVPVLAEQEGLGLVVEVADVLLGY